MIQYDHSDKVLANIANSFLKRLRGDIELFLKIDPSMDKYTAVIENGTITAGSHSQMLYALGRVLRNKHVAGTFTSYKKVSGMYFATHFKNYLDAAPLDEIYDYMDDLAFWGMNVFSLWFDMHHYHNMQEATEVVNKQKAMLRHANDMGIETQLVMVSDEAFADSPKHLRADWRHEGTDYIYDFNSHYHVEICPSKEGGIEQIVKSRREMLEAFKDVDINYVSIGGYDQGGCTCKDCFPWGCNGNVRTIDAIVPVIKEYYPKVEIILSMWQFGTFTGNDIEFIGIKNLINEGKLPYVKYVVAEPQYAEYPFRKGMSVPILNFTEISMFGANPWGGYGANPLPGMFQDIWDKSGDKLEGGTPYSEGLYEDVNKVIMLRFYRDNQSAADTVREYLSYEFDLEGEMLDKAYTAVMMMEDTLEREYKLPCHRNDAGVTIMDPPETIVHRYPIKNTQNIEKIEELMKEVHDSLSDDIKENKKWQLLYLRAIIDGELLRNDFYRNDKVFEMFKKIEKIAHLEKSGVATHPDTYTTGKDSDWALK